MTEKVYTTNRGANDNAATLGRLQAVLNRQGAELRALAEMVILGERELPEIGALSALTAEDLEWHDPEGDGEAEQ